MRVFLTHLMGLIAFVSAGSVYAGSPTLSAGNSTIAGGESGNVVVSGNIAGQETYSVTIQVQIFARAGNSGTVTFTPSPPPDIAQLEDPWPEAGTFEAFDTDITGWLIFNGSVDENGDLIARPLTFSGPLSSFPVQASIDAYGVWDVALSTFVGDSLWGGQATTLTPGTITVTASPAIPTASEWGLLVLAALLLVAGGVVIARRQGTSTPA